MTTKRATPNQEAFRFFFANAGYSYDPKKETKAKGRARCARELAKAERDASALGYTFEWEYDNDADDSFMTDEEKSQDHEAFYCVCRDQDGEIVSSLGGIFDPTREYRRVVEAELADEALAQNSAK